MVSSCIHKNIFETLYGVNGTQKYWSWCMAINTYFKMQQWQAAANSIWVRFEGELEERSRMEMKSFALLAKDDLPTSIIEGFQNKKNENPFVGYVEQASWANWVALIFHVRPISLPFRWYLTTWFWTFHSRYDHLCCFGRMPDKF